MKEICQRCHEYGEDRREILMESFYAMEELGIPFEMKTITTHTKDSLEIYTLVVCKKCRADWLESICEWYHSFPKILEKKFMNKPCDIATHLNSTSDELMDMLPACLDTKENAPFNNYWLQVHKRSMSSIRYIVRYVCDTFSVEDLENPLSERVLHKTHSESLTDALAQMYFYLLEHHKDCL